MHYTLTVVGLFRHVTSGGVRGGGGHGLRRRRESQPGAGLSCIGRSAIRNYVLLCEKDIFFCRGRW